MLALPALAESEIPGILARISRGLGSLNGSLAAYEGGAGAGLSRILADSTALKKELDAGSTQAGTAPALAFPDALGLAAGTAGLARATNGTVATLVADKPAFDEVGVSSVVLDTVRDLRASTRNFGHVVVSKLPLEIEPVGVQLVLIIDDALARGVKAYS